MAIYLSNIAEAYGPLVEPLWEGKENPQHFDSLVSSFESPMPQRHILGIVGGNEASVIKGNQTDLESDLRGINIPNTFCPSRQYHPPLRTDREIIRNNVKGAVAINVQMNHMPTYQMMAYPAVMAPLPMVNEVCKNPEKY